jgi:hypothetical protein
MSLGTLQMPRSTSLAASLQPKDFPPEMEIHGFFAGAFFKGLRTSGISDPDLGAFFTLQGTTDRQTQSKKQLRAHDLNHQRHTPHHINEKGSHKETTTRTHETQKRTPKHAHTYVVAHDDDFP